MLILLFFLPFCQFTQPTLISWLLKALISWSRVMKECWSWRIFSLFCSFSATLPIYWSFMINDVLFIAFGGEPPLLVDFKQTYAKPNHMGWITHLKENQLLHEPIKVQEHCPWHSCDPKHALKLKTTIFHMNGSTINYLKEQINVVNEKKKRKKISIVISCLLQEDNGTHPPYIILPFDQDPYRWLHQILIYYKEKYNIRWSIIS